MPRILFMHTEFSFPTLDLFLRSMLIGLSIAAPVGQIGILAIQRTLDQGRAAGLATGMGAAFADAMYGAMGAFGVTALITWLLGLQLWLGLIGGSYLLWLAWQTARRPSVKGGSGHLPAGTLRRHVSGTFLLTLSNPTTILAFMAVFGALAGGASIPSPWVMVLGVFLGSALWWLILSTGVAWLRDRFDERWQKAVNLGSAVMLAAIGAWQLARLFDRA